MTVRDIAFKEILLDIPRCSPGRVRVGFSIFTVVLALLVLNYFPYKYVFRFNSQQAFGFSPFLLPGHVVLSFHVH